MSRRADTAARPLSPEDRLAFLAAAAFGTSLNEVWGTMLEAFKSEVLEPVRGWCQEHEDRLTRCYLAIYDETPAVFVVVPGDEHDEGLGRLLCDLRRHIYQTTHVFLHVIQVPDRGPESLRTYVDESRSIQLFPAVAAHAER